jgi:hypothetical protein
MLEEATEAALCSSGSSSLLMESSVVQWQAAELLGCSLQTHWR